MKPPQQARTEKEVRKPLPTPEEALRVIQEYADDLRAIIKRLRQRLN